MIPFEIPERSQLTESNQAVYDQVKRQLGFVPNLYAYMAKHANALPDYLAFLGRKSTLSNKEKELISLVVSQGNGCVYCQSAHTALGKMHGFTEGEILEIRTGSAPFNAKLDALAKFVASLTDNRGKASPVALDNLLKAGYSEEQLIDIIFVIADKTITNFIAITAGIAIDFPVAKTIEPQETPIN